MRRRRSSWARRSGDMGCTNAYRTDRRHWTCRDRVLLPRLDRPPREVRDASGADDRERRGARPLSEPCKQGCPKAGRDFCGFDIAAQGGRRASCCRHLDGRSLLHRRASPDIAIAHSEWHPGSGRCRKAGKVQDHRHHRHAHGDGDAAVRGNLVGDGGRSSKTHFIRRRLASDSKGGDEAVGLA